MAQTGALCLDETSAICHDLGAGLGQFWNELCGKPEAQCAMVKAHFLAVHALLVQSMADPVMDASCGELGGSGGNQTVGCCNGAGTVGHGHSNAVANNTLQTSVQLAVGSWSAHFPCVRSADRIGFELLVFPALCST
jgi:hypothetical protein